MATIAEVLTRLNSLEKTNYRKVIEITETLALKRKIQYTILRSFMQKRYNRVNNLVTQTNTYFQTQGTSIEYRTFQGYQANIDGRNDTITMVNGLVNRSIYGDVKEKRMWDREKSELSKRITLITNYISQLSDAQTNLTLVKNQLPAETT